MTQRTRKVASLIQQVVAAELQERLRAPEVSVTSVDVSPDLRHALVWLGIIETEKGQSAPELFKQAEAIRPQLQDVVAKRLTSKFVPKISLRQDSSGEYAQHIGRLMNNL